MTENTEDLFSELDNDKAAVEAPAVKKRTRKKSTASTEGAVKEEMTLLEEASSDVATTPTAPLEPANEEAEKPHVSPSLLSGLLPLGNAGSGIISLSRNGSAPVASSVQLPPPKAVIDKKHSGQNSSNQSNGRQSQSSQTSTGSNSNSHGNQKNSSGNSGSKSNGNSFGNGNGRHGGSYGGSRFVRDDVAFVEQSMDESEMEMVYEPAYVDDVKHDIVRPRLDRYELLKASPEILAKMGNELGGLIAGPDTTIESFVDQLIEKNNQSDGVNDITFGSGVVVRTKESGDFGVLRSAEVDYVGTTADIYLTPLYMKRYGLRVGDSVLGTIKRRDKDGMSAMIKVYAINGIAPDQRRGLRPFETLIPYYPTQRLFMENGEKNYSMRVMDLITPIGRGQRGLIVAPPRTGKTVMLQNMANAILENNEDITLIVMLIDERPEEVTDMRDRVKAEVVASTFDEPPEKHKELMELVMERCKRMVENGRHVIVLLDSITRLARAYNTLAPKSGRILSGGLDANALYAPKRFFGAARNIQGGGSLTILATALIDTGSRMDELIFEEFKGTGNMELHLDRALADRRIFPAIDCLKSGTRREELIVHADELEQMWSLRKVLTHYDSVEAMDKLLKNISPFPSNALFMHRIQEARAANAARDAKNNNQQPNIGVAELGDIKDELQS